MSDDEVEKALAGGTKFRAYRDEDNNENVRIYELPKDNALGIARIALMESDRGYNTLSIQANGSGNKESFRDSVTALLAQGNITVTNVKDGTGGGAVNLTFQITGKPDEVSLARAVMALSKDAEKGRSDKHYAVIAPEIANAVVGNELEVTSKKPSELGLVDIDMITVEGNERITRGFKQDQNYLGTVTITYPHSQIQHVSELAYLTESSTAETVYEIHTRLETTAPQQVTAALKAAGVKIDNEQKQEGVIVAEAPADIAMNALTKHGKNIIPDFIAGEIAKKAHEAHPDQVAINADAYQAGQERLSALVEKTTGSRPATGGRTTTTPA